MCLIDLANEVVMQFNSVEDAYKAFAKYLLAFVGVRQWDEAGASFTIYSKMAKGEQWLKFRGELDEKGGFESNPGAVWDGLDAATYLRDSHLMTTNQRVWGIKFVLYPDGKFKLDYDYDRPEGYEESEEEIPLENAVKSLNSLLAPKK
jgi:hypothetical protein